MNEQLLALLQSYNLDQLVAYRANVESTLDVARTSLDTALTAAQRTAVQQIIDRAEEILDAIADEIARRGASSAMGQAVPWLLLAAVVGGGALLYLSGKGK